MMLRENHPAGIFHCDFCYIFWTLQNKRIFIYLFGKRKEENQNNFYLFIDLLSAFFRIEFEYINVYIHVCFEVNIITIDLISILFIATKC